MSASDEFGGPATTVQPFVTSDGVSLHRVTVEARGTVKARMAILHGYAEHGGRYLDLARAWAHHGIESHLMDFRGHGRSPGRPGVVEDRDRFVDDALELWNSLQGPDVCVTSFGHSFGGAVALKAAQRRPDLLDAMIVSAPYLTTALSTPPWVFRLADRLSRTFPYLPTLKVDADTVSTLAEEVRRYVEDPLVFRGGVPLVTVRELHAIGDDVRDAVSSWVTPTLVLHSRHDRLSSYAGSAGLVQAAKAGAEVVLKSVDDVGHDLLADASSEVVKRWMVVWLLETLEFMTEDVS